MAAHGDGGQRKFHETAGCRVLASPTRDVAEVVVLDGGDLRAALTDREGRRARTS